MKYTFDDIELFSRPRSFNNTTKKEILQYAVSGLLYMPATKTKIINDILTQKHPEFKSICLDLEDSIGDDTVPQAEENVTTILRTLSEACKNETLSIDDIPLIFIRVREPKQVERIFENAGKYFDVLTGFNFPKFDKTNAKEYLNSFDTVQKKYKKILYFTPTYKINESNGHTCQYNKNGIIAASSHTISREISWLLSKARIKKIVAKGTVYDVWSDL